METPQSVQARTRWGRSRFGGSEATLIAATLAGGLVIAAGVGWLVVASEGTRFNPWIAFGVSALLMLPASAGLVWALLVDRSTLTGALDDPESSIESRWFDKSAAGAFHFLVAALGLGAAVFSFVTIEIAVPLLLGGYFLIALSAFAVNYLLTKRADT